MADAPRRPADLTDPLQGAFVNDEQQRLLEIEEMRLVVKFGGKKRYSDREYEAVYQETRRGHARHLNSMHSAWRL